MRRLTNLATILAMAVGLSACGPGATTTPAGGGEAVAPDLSANKTLVIAVRSEASSAAAKALLTSGSNITPPTLFNAGLALIDDQEVPRPFLAESLPQVNTDAWRVFPDGRMETTYTLKPNLTWQDGTPLSAEDFVFALSVYKVPELGSSSPSPQNIIDEIQAPDSRTVVFRWRQPHADAGAVAATELQALPRHILAEPFRNMDSSSFAAHPFWTTQYVGLGPYRIERWDHGIALEASAFDNYVLGKPKIGQIRVVYIADPNTVIANMLAGEADYAIANSLPFVQAMTLKREWDNRGGAGTVHVAASGSRTAEFQLHPDRVAESFRGTLDVRVRRALAHALDKPGINEGVFEGQGLMADTRIQPNVDYFPQVDRATVKYPFDLRRSEQLMTEAGYTKGPDGIYVSPSGLRFSGVDWIAASPQSELMQAIMLDTWKRAGFEITPHFLSTVEQRDAQIRAERPALYTGDGGSIETLGSESIPRPENRWTGSNRGSYSSPEMDRLLASWRAELDRGTRNGLMVQVSRLYSEDLPSIPINYILACIAHTRGLRGPTSGPSAPGLNSGAASVLDIHLFEWRP